jgi:hypothetical protein
VYQLAQGTALPWGFAWNRLARDKACQILSAKREIKYPRALVKELDLEFPIHDGLRLPNELI